MKDNVITRIRQKHGITQEELAHVLNVSYTSVNAWETEKRKPQVRMQKVLSELLATDELSDYIKSAPQLNMGIRRTDAGFVSTVIDYGNLRDPYPYTHGFGRWYGSLPSFLVKNLLAFLSTDLNNGGDAIVNFGGSGTVALELATSGRTCLAVDANPVAVLLSKVKTTPLNSSFTVDLLREARRVVYEEHILSDFSGLSKDNLLISDAKWIPPDVRRFILGCLSSIKRLDTNEAKNILTITLASIMIDYCCVDKRCTNHYVYKDAVTFSKETFAESYIGAIESFVQKNKELSSILNYKTPKVRLGDACALPADDESASLVFSHPPYGTTINYYAMSRIALSVIEAAGILSSKSDIFADCRNDDISSGTLSRFSSFTQNWVSEAYRVLKPGGVLVVVIGDSRNAGSLSHPFTDVISIGEQVGFLTKEIFIWITNHKAGMHVRRKGNHIDHNYILFLEKKR